MTDPTADRGWLPPLQGLIAPTVTVEAWTRNDPDDAWDPLDVARDPRDCLPGLTLCSETACMEGWLLDHFLRVLDRGIVVWTSTGAPGRARLAEQSGEAVIIPFSHR